MDTFTGAAIQVFGQAPVFLTCFLGILLGAVLCQRSGLAGMLLIGGSLWLLAMALVWPFVMTAVYRQMAPNPGIMAGVNIAGSLIRSVGMVMIMAAALVGRGPVSDQS